MKIVGLLFGIVAVIVLGSVWSGFVLQVLWGWFIVPTFHLPSISIALGIGIAGVIRLLTAYQPQEQSREQKESSTKTLIAALSWSFFYPLFILGFGFVVHLFV